MMIRVGLREANLHFSKYLKMVEDGKEIVLTKRGKSIAIIKPFPHKEETEEERIISLEEQGILRRAIKDRFPVHELIAVRGKPVSEIVREEREDRF